MGMSVKSVLIEMLAAEEFKRAVEVQRNCMKVRLDFAYAIRAEMDRRGMTQDHLALRLHKSRAYVNQVLRGRHNLESATMVKLADAVGLQVKFGLESKKQKEDEK